MAILWVQRLSSRFLFRYNIKSDAKFASLEKYCELCVVNVVRLYITTSYRNFYGSKGTVRDL